MIKKHPYLFAALIGALLVLNLWKWLPSASFQGGPKSGAAAHGLWSLDFPDPLGAGEKEIHRNLFEAGAALGNGPVRRPLKLSRLSKVQPTAVPTPSDVAADGSVAEVAGGYRLLGIASREGQAKALIGKGDQLFQVGQGGDIEGKYEVQTITESEVYLTEKQSGNTLKLRIWDNSGGLH